MRGAFKKILLGIVAAASLWFVAPQPTARADEYWDGYWNWYDTSYRPYYYSRGGYYRPYSGGYYYAPRTYYAPRPYYYNRPYRSYYYGPGYSYGYGPGYYGPGYYGRGGHVRVGPLNFGWW